MYPKNFNPILVAWLDIGFASRYHMISSPFITSGTKTQKSKSIPDTADIFVADTLKGGAKKPELAKVRGSKERNVF